MTEGREHTDIVGKELRARRLRVEIASNPDEGEALVRKLLTAGDRVVLVSDLRMPSASEDGLGERLPTSLSSVISNRRYLHSAEERWG
jgi:hypothetical protein